MSLLQITIVIMNILEVYTLYKLINVFFDREYVNRRIEIISYIAYYVLNSIISISIHIPIVLFLFTIFSIFGLTFNHMGSMKRHILSTLYIYIMCFCVELASAMLFEKNKIFIFKDNEVGSSYAVVAYILILYMVALIFSGKKFNIKKEREVPVSYWLGIISVPALSLIFILLFFDAVTEKTKPHLIIAIFLIVLLNLITFNLYNNTLLAMRKASEKAVLEVQNASYSKQLKLMQDDIKNISIMRHDMKNHLLTLKGMYEEGKTEQFGEYLDDLFTKTSKKEEIVSSGNTVIDSIINYKLIGMTDVKILTDVCVPETLEISDFDIAAILANLLDNSVRALKEMKEEKSLSVKINYKQGRLNINIVNSYEGKLNFTSGKIATTKKDKKRHGLGLISVEETVNKYNGTMQTDYENGRFDVTVSLCC